MSNDQNDPSIPGFYHRSEVKPESNLMKAFDVLLPGKPAPSGTTALIASRDARIAELEAENADLHRRLALIDRLSALVIEAGAGAGGQEAEREGAVLARIDRISAAVERIAAERDAARRERDRLLNAAAALARIAIDAGADLTNLPDYDLGGTPAPPGLARAIRLAAGLGDAGARDDTKEGTNG